MADLPIKVRAPSQSEMTFFRQNPSVAGYAAPDGNVVLNPLTTLTRMERQSVIRNETARILMRRSKELTPLFDLTPEQGRAFATYGPLQQQRETIAARLVAGDPSALEPSLAQLQFVQRLLQALEKQQRPRNPSASGRMQRILERD